MKLSMSSHLAKGENKAVPVAVVKPIELQEKEKRTQKKKDKSKP